MSAGLIFRPARAGDAPELKRLNDAFNGPGPKSLSEMERDLAAPLGERVFVAQEGSALRGFCCCQIKRSFCYETVAVEITELYVEPGFQGRGVGKGLLKCAGEYFKDKPVEKFELLTGDDNCRAQGFYEHLGFSRSGELHYEKEIGS